MAINAALALSGFLANYTLKRYTSGSYVNGVFSNSSSTSTIVAAVMPLTGQEIIRIPEGNRTTSRLKIYTTFPLYASIESGSVQADEITVNGISYQVESVENWGDFYKSLLVKIGGT